MKHHELRQPLIRSVVVLVVIFFLIAFVASSEASGFLGGISSIFTGLFYSVLFVIALTIGVIISIFLLFAIFFGAVAIYSPDASRDLFTSLKMSLAHQKEAWANCCSCTSAETKETDVTPDPVLSLNISEEQEILEEEDENEVEAIKEALTQEIAIIGEEIQLLQDNNTTLRDSFSEFKELIEKKQAEEIEASLEQITALQKKVDESSEAGQQKIKNLEEVSTSQAQSSNGLSKKIDSMQKQVQTLSESLQELQNNVEESIDDEQVDTADTSHRIFNYLENDKDKEKFAALIKESVDKSLTYAEINTFLSQSLSKKNDAIIKDHPSLTKQYIRDCKNAR